MSTPNHSTHAHCEPQRIAKAAGPDSGTAGVNVTNPKPRPNVLLPQNVSPAKTMESDGRTARQNTPTTIGQKTPVIISGSGPKMPGLDRSRTPAKPPASTNKGNFVSFADMPGVVGLRPGEVEFLGSHGITVGVAAGVLSIARIYVPAATSLLAQMRGGT
jgi:hypothetical protein